MPLTDRERILLSIINHLGNTILLAGHLQREEQFRSYDGRLYVHFAGYRKPEPGDLVLAFTGPVSEWKVAWFVRWLQDEHGEALLREIGSDRECRYGNESFKPIVGLYPDELLEGDRYQFLLKVHRAFRRGDEYMYRYGGLEFPAKHEARVWVREAFGGLNRKSLPFAVDLHWTKKTSAAAILRAMKAAGYGARKFESALSPVAGD